MTIAYHQCLSEPGFGTTDRRRSPLNLTAALAAFPREGYELRSRLIVERVLQDVGQPCLTLGYPPRIVPTYRVLVIAKQVGHVSNRHAGMITQEPHLRRSRADP